MKYGEKNDSVAVQRQNSIMCYFLHMFVFVGLSVCASVGFFWPLPIPGEVQEVCGRESRHWIMF